ncbi:LLM class flavin-dependent oxidoreductase [Vineibacter terrae]|uniref:LLM class flavin-dependent oxidoreductase n=2 Tax=Vineibacter terrae TaxID=2586908 RepID=A0A5C8P956_9HYPH|nr:LLM class flavin-dependent oxidoreductase [Vineibacter terrae]
MHVGMAVIFQNPGGARSDHDVYRTDVELARSAEKLGFDSVWAVEHHFTDYTMCPDPMQFLSYMAGCTEHVLLGSMVVVLPWHNPLRAAEQIVTLDNLSNGRVILGIGRGLGRVEFDRFHIPMEESRPRFVEAAEMVLAGLENGYVEYDGKFYKQMRADIRPAPIRSFKGRTYAAAVSPESSRIMAQLGVGILIIPQKPWKEVQKELGEYRRIFRDVRGIEAPQPLSAGWVFVDENADRAAEKAHEYIGSYYKSVIEHYEFVGDHLKSTGGYEYYGEMQNKLGKLGSKEFVDFFVDLQVWGTPEQCYERIMKIHGMVNNSGFNAVLSYGNMPPEEARRNRDTFVRTIMPELKKFDAGAPIDLSPPLQAAAE